jgi:signal transduction histidine kinase
MLSPHSHPPDPRLCTMLVYNRRTPEPIREASTLNQPVADAIAPAVQPVPARPGAQLHGTLLTAARGVWLVIATLTFIFVLVTFPSQYALLEAPCTGEQCPFLAITRDDLSELSQMGLSASVAAAHTMFWKIAFALVSLAVGTALFWRKSDQRIALLMGLALVTLGGTAFSGPLGNYLGGFSALWQALATLLSFLGNTLIVFSYYVFPDGRFVPSWIKLPAILFVVLQIDGYFFGVMSGWLAPVNLWLLLGVFASIIFAQVYRYVRVSDPAERQQTKWVVFGIIGTVLGTQLVDLALPNVPLSHVYLVFTGTAFYFLSLLLMPLSIGVAVLRYRLWDIDILINRTLVYGALTALVVALYVVIVGSLSALLQVSGNLLVSLIATGVIAAIFQPLRERLQRGANRILYGERDDPYRVLSNLGQRLGQASTPEALLPNVVDTIAQALKVPYAAIALRQGDELKTAASYGHSVSNPIRLPLVYQGAEIGELSLARRAPGEPFSKGDMALLQSIAHEAGIAARAVQLTADLQHSRERLVTAREEERRRLRRDLHDGLGPVLGALTLKLDAARNLLATNPEAVDRLLLDLKAQSQGAIADIRRLVYELRPPALDDLGLASAVRQHASQLSSLNGLSITVEMSETLPALSAAVEVATYRIVQEALNNVVRHAGARKCLVRITVNGSLDIEIIDDGVGLPPERQAGIGLISMRERAEELGGSFAAGSGHEGGTRIFARLPLAAPASQTAPAADR